jgi:hypothetical protein
MPGANSAPMHAGVRGSLLLDAARKRRKKDEAGHGEKSVIRLHQRSSTLGIRGRRSLQSYWEGANPFR